MKIETWIGVPGCRRRYQVSNRGRIRSMSRTVPSARSKSGFRVKKTRIMKQVLVSNGYLYCSLWMDDGRQKNWAVHRLVAKMFVDNPNNLPQVNHKDTVKTNNKVSNLEWTTHQGNMDHGKEHGLFPRGEDHCLSKLTKENVMEIRRMLSDGCSVSSIARHFNVSRSPINQLKRGETWKHIPIEEVN